MQGQVGVVCLRRHRRLIREVQIGPIALGTIKFAQINQKLQGLEKKALISLAGLRRRPRGGLGSEFWAVPQPNSQARKG